MSTEEWRPVVKYEGAYEVSNLGNVRSVDRCIVRNGSPARLRGRQRSLKAQATGHMNVTLSLENVFTTVRVHRLVAEAFLGPIPDGAQVHHIDGDPANNRVENLKFGSPAENSLDMIAHGRSTRGRRAHSSKLTVEDVRAIRKARKNGALLRELAEAYGVHNVAISAACRGKNWGWLDAPAQREDVI